MSTTPNVIELSYYEVGIRLSQAKVLVDCPYYPAVHRSAFSRLESAVAALQRCDTDCTYYLRVREMQQQCWEYLTQTSADQRVDENFLLIRNHLKTIREMLASAIQDYHANNSRLLAWFKLGSELARDSGYDDEPYDPGEVDVLLTKAETTVADLFPKQAGGDLPWAQDDIENIIAFGVILPRWTRLEEGLAHLKDQTKCDAATQGKVAPDQALQDPPSTADVSTAGVPQTTPGPISDRQFEIILERAGRLSPRKQEILEVLRSAGRRQTNKEIVALLDSCLAKEKREEGLVSFETVKNYLSGFTSLNVLDNRQDTDSKGYWFHPSMLS